jgi:hypothetical protein
LKDEIDKSKRKLKEADDSFQKRQGELDVLVQQVSDKNMEILSATEKKNRLDIESARLTDELDSLNISITQKEKQEKELVEKISLMQNQLNELSAKVNDLTQKYESLKQKIKEDKEELNNTANQLKKEKSELAIAEGQKNTANKVLAELAKHREQNAECWKDLDTPYIKDGPKPVESKLIEIEWLDGFITKLTNNDICFNERMIKGFHTGLKCADIAPLVVLAGISGTGKSLLPELYAASLGMNFLSVAIQPRWDSPQDLFGFYNYMDNRYKATELSRLLWQFDKYNNNAAKAIYEKQIPMNLVLLDEMNLARVEYYFSDLLSKLETRRGLDAENQNSRRNGEIEIESNAAASKEHRRRLFVAANTLFVGTMNEDESTQTLSDKVIDRSNVLRFGRPEKLGAKPNKTRFLEECASTTPIVLNNWNRWLAKPNKQNILKMQKILQPLNEKLDLVGRPFAHRVWQAMENYVAYYPGSDDKAFNAALADQIEMKILPKLNGLEFDVPEFDTVKRELEQIIGGLDDDGLGTAFMKSCDGTHNTFFKWRGVMR